MEHNENQAVITFDTLYTNNHIQILKVLLPYFDGNSRKKLAVLIKFMELRYTMEYFSRHMALECAGEQDSDSGKPDIVKIFEQIKNFCTPSERAMFDQLANMKKSMEMYEEMMNMMQLFSQLSPDGGMPFGGGGSDSSGSDDGGEANFDGNGNFNCGENADYDSSDSAGFSGSGNADCGSSSDNAGFSGSGNADFNRGGNTDFDSNRSASASAAYFDQFSQSSMPFGSANPMEMLKGMLSPEQQAMFEMFQSSFGNK